MVDALYLTAVALLFVPWTYGLYALARDGKNRLVPLVRRYLRGRRQIKQQAEAEAEREEQERQLY
jgi:hypothetical protein